MMIRFEDKLAGFLNRRGETFNHACQEMRMYPKSYYGKKIGKHNIKKSTIMAWAYYLGVKAEDLVSGTDMESYYYGGEGRTQKEET